MIIWIFWNRANGENYTTAHLTQKGAYLAGINDILEWYAVRDDPDYFLKTLSERGDNPQLAQDPPPYLEEELKKLSHLQLRQIFGEWAELTWDGYEYECEIMKTRIQG